MLEEGGQRKDAMLARRMRTSSVITITGLPGSGSELVGNEIARLTGYSFADDEIPKAMCQRLKCSIGEIKSLESGYQSWWGRLIRASMYWGGRYAPYDSGFDLGGGWPQYHGDALDDYLTKEQYLKGLKGVIKGLARQGDVVLHGQGSHLYIQSDITALHVFVTASPELRKQKVAADHRMSLKNAEKWLKRADRATVSMFKYLLGTEIFERSKYDLVLDLGELSYRQAALLAIKQMESVSLNDQEEELASHHPRQRAHP